jgi:hypothetical protein
MNCVMLVLFVLGFGTPVVADEAECRFAVGEAVSGNALQLVEDPAAPYQYKTMDGAAVVGPAPNSDYFQRARLRFRVDSPFPAAPGQTTLVIEYMDEGIGLIGVRYDTGRARNDKAPEDNPVYSSARGLAGYTCLGTGKTRHAVFLLSGPQFQHRQEGGTDLCIEGVSALKCLTLRVGPSDEEVKRARQEIPTEIPPKLTLARPMELVITVGAHSGRTTDLPGTLERMRELCPVATALGFTGVESYVTWRNVETEKGRYDWSFYDSVAAEAGKYGLKWFPLLIVGSAYALPDWFHDSSENVGFVCLEHHKENNIQSIFCDNQIPYVKGFLDAFGAHYEPMGALLGVRLGPSGNYGESQYPAGGNWGYGGTEEHIHIGWWAGDPHAALRFREFLTGKYKAIAALNQAWEETYASFDDIQIFVPQFAETLRKRKDFVDWYMGAMTDWCEKWAVWARAAMPNTAIYQSSGGWGFVESGTDFTEQTKSMAKVQGGIRATNETDSYAQNFYATRMMSSAARFYGVPFGSEPAGFGSARAVAARIYNILVNNGRHLFFYESNILHNDQAATKWLELAPLLDRRGEPLVEVAALYPDTKSKLDDSVFRNLYSFTFNERVAALRPRLDFDFCSERMILDGALSRYKVLLFLWSNVVESDVLDKIDNWVQNGGAVIYPYWSGLPLVTVEGDYAVYNRWLRGETGKGKVIIDRDDRVPAHRYTDFIAARLMEMPNLDPLTQQMLHAQKPDEVYVSVLNDGTFVVLNYNDIPVSVTIPSVGTAEGAFRQRSSEGTVTVGPYSIEILRAG